MNATSPNEESLAETKKVVLRAENKKLNVLSLTIHTYLKYVGQKEQNKIEILETFMSQKLVRTCFSINNDDADGDGEG